jgi:HTH-type transcriptional regulator/antitoxin HigA
MAEDYTEAFAPGDFLKDELEERGWSQVDFAAIIGRDVGLVNGIILGKRGITPKTATAFSKALGTSAEVWLRLDADYRLAKLRMAPSSLVERRSHLYSKVPIKEMMRRRWIEEPKNPKDVDTLEQNILAFLGKASLDEVCATTHAAKKATSYQMVTGGQEAWMARAKQLAQGVTAASYSVGTMDALLARLRDIMHAPEEARLVPRLLADAGIRFLVVEPLSGTGIDGVTFWLNSESPVVTMSLRYDRIDNFWFVLLHELGHVMRHDGLNNTPALDIEIESKGDMPPEERAASDFAGRHLIPQEELKDFVIRTDPLFSTFKIQGFANRIGVHPGIVVGRLQHLEIVDWSHHRRLLAPIRQEVTQVALTDGWGHLPQF